MTHTDIRRDLLQEHANTPVANWPECVESFSRRVLENKARFEHWTGPPHMTCMYPPPHMTCMYPPQNKTRFEHWTGHMTCMYPPPHMTCMYPPHNKARFEHWTGFLHKVIFLMLKKGRSRQAHLQVSLSPSLLPCLLPPSFPPSLPPSRPLFLSLSHTRSLSRPHSVSQRGHSHWLSGLVDSAVCILLLI